jgi:hypothetical protein
MSLEVPRSGFRLISGAPRFWSRATDTGGRLSGAFCPDCGTRLWHEADGSSKTITIKAGSLDDPVDASAAIHIWTDRKLQGIDIPRGAVQFPKEPD